jgi:hypothetical protein
VNSAVNAPVQWTSKTPKLTLNAAPNLKCWSLSLLQNGDFVSSSSYNGSNTVLQKKVSMFRITVSLLLARNNKYQNFKNPTLELT